MKTPERGSLTETMKKRLVHLEGGIVEVSEAYRKVKKALCGNANAPLSEVLQTVDQLKSRRAQAERERDAALYDMHQLQGAICAYCANLYRPDGTAHVHCRVFGDLSRFDDDNECSPLVCGKFKWRGVCAENSK